MSEDLPPSVALAASGELERRAGEAFKQRGPRCVDRPSRRRRLVLPALRREVCLRGSGTIFFSGCNLRCVFC